MSESQEDQQRQIMDQRARRLAGRSNQQEQRVTAVEVAVVHVGDQRYGVPVEGISEIVRRPPLTPLPGLPDWIPGLAVVRGDLICAVDLARWFRVGDAADRPPDYLALLEEAGGRQLGLLVNGVEGFREIHVDEVAEHLTDQTGEQDRLVTITTKDLVAVLDLRRLFASPEISREAVMGSAGLARSRRRADGSSDQVEEVR